MTKQEALNLFNLYESAGKDEILRRYNELYSDYQMRLTNAPTPNLKKLYQNNLGELEEARNLLVSTNRSVQTDLPSSSPVLVEAISEKILSTPFQVSNNNIDNKQVKKENSKKGNFLTSTVWIILSIILLSSNVLIFILWSDANDLVNKNLEELNLANSEIQKYSLIKNGKLEIENSGSTVIMIGAVTAVYFNKDNQLQKYEGGFNTIIRPGSKVSFSMVEGGEMIWDGSAVFYSFTCEAMGQQFQVGGSLQMDAYDGVLKINLDPLLKPGNS